MVLETNSIYVKPVEHAAFWSHQLSTVMRTKRLFLKAIQNATVYVVEQEQLVIQEEHAQNG